MAQHTMGIRIMPVVEHGLYLALGPSKIQLLPC